MAYKVNYEKPIAEFNQGDSFFRRCMSDDNDPLSFNQAAAMKHHFLSLHYGIRELATSLDKLSAAVERLENASWQTPSRTSTPLARPPHG